MKTLLGLFRRVSYPRVVRDSSLAMASALLLFAALVAMVAGVVSIPVAAIVYMYMGAGAAWVLLTGYYLWGVAALLIVAALVTHGIASARLARQRRGAMKRIVSLAALFAFVAAAPIGAWAAGYETRSGGTNSSETISGVPVPGGGTRSTSTSNYDSFSRSRPVYDGWERANMTASTAVNVVGAMQSIAGLLGGLSTGPVVATPMGVYAPNGNGGYGGGYYGGGYGYNGGQVPPFVYQRPVTATAPPAPICYPYAGVCDVWTPAGWQRIPMPQQPAQPTVTVQVGPRCGYEQRTDGRGMYWQEYVCR